MTSPDKLNDKLREASDKSTAASQATADVAATKLAATAPDNVSSTANTSSDDASVGTARTTQRKAVTTDIFASYSRDSAIAKSLVAAWESYNDDAAPAKRQTAASLKALQTRLVNLVVQTVNTDSDDDFLTVSQRLLTLMAENKKGSFNLGALYRGLTVLSVSDKVVNNVRFALDAYLTFSNVANRKNAIRVYNLQQSATVCKTSDKRERFIGYFTKIAGGN